MNRTLIVFAKEPVNGTVKTRLRNCFSDNDLIRLYKAFIKDTLAVANDIRNARKILAFSSRTAPRFLKSVAGGFEMIEQKGRTLGDRIHNAFLYAKNNKAEKIVIIGSDSPTLAHDVIQRAFRKLDSCDIVLGPAADGGYYLVGMRESHRALFKGIKWSCRSVLDNTLTRAKQLGKKIAQLNSWYDVDDCDSLARLRCDLIREKNKDTAKYTRRFLKI